VRIDDGYVFIKASVSKTRTKRFPPLMPNAIAWVNLYLEKVGGTPDPEALILDYTVGRLGPARRKNYEAATGKKGACPVITSQHLVSMISCP
jgi:hypothetical protein